LKQWQLANILSSSAYSLFLIVVFLTCGKKWLVVIASITVTISSFMFLLLPMLKNGHPPIIACGSVAMLIALAMLLLILVSLT